MSPKPMAPSETPAEGAAPAPKPKYKGNPGTPNAREIQEIKDRRKAMREQLRPLDERQRKFVEMFANTNCGWGAALQAAGYPKEQHKSLEWRFAKAKNIQYALSLERERAEKAGLMTKKKVLDGFLEAVDVARLQADANAMTGAWREIAKMCGYFEPTKHKLEVSVNGQVVIQKLQALDDQSLLALADGHADAIEGEFKVVE